MADTKQKMGALSVSSLGHSLAASMAASNDILFVARELEQAANTATDKEEQAKLMRWADQLADAVITISSSASSTATEIGPLSPGADDKREK